MLITILSILCVVLFAALLVQTMHVRRLQKEKETIRQDAKVQLQQQDDFLHELVHDLRNPAAGLYTLTELALQSELDADQQEHCLAQMHTAANQLLTIMNERVPPRNHKSPDELLAALKGLRILLDTTAVPEEETITALKNAGAIVTTAPDSQQLLRILPPDCSGFDLLLLDGSSIDGPAVARTLRKWETSHNTPHLLIFGVTADVTIDSARKCLDSGMDGALTQPLKLAALASEIIRHKAAAH